MIFQTSFSDQFFAEISTGGLFKENNLLFYSTVIFGSVLGIFLIVPIFALFAPSYYINQLPLGMNPWNPAPMFGPLKGALSRYIAGPFS